jgi:phospholipid/cholesterol/gamma-HCH transport system substrate-binding protein
MKNKETSNRIRLGIFVTAGLLLLIIAIFFIGKQKHLFGNTFTVKATFSDIAGLMVGNNVRFSGINIGRVEDIVIITDSSVQVVMVLDSKIQKFIKKDAKALVGSEGLMGNKVVNISPGTTGSNQIIRDNDTIGTKKLASMDDIMDKMDGVAANAVLITDDLYSVTSGIRSGKGLIGKLIYDPTMAASIDKTLSNVEGATGAMQDDLEALQHNFLFKKGFKVKPNEVEKAKQDKLKVIEAAEKAKVKRDKAVADSIKKAD